MRKERYINMTDIIKNKKVLVGNSYFDVPTGNDEVRKAFVKRGEDIMNLRETINSQAQIIAELSAIKYELERHFKEIQLTLDDLKQSLQKRESDQ